MKLRIIIDLKLVFVCTPKFCSNKIFLGKSILKQLYELLLKLVQFFANSYFNPFIQSVALEYLQACVSIGPTYTSTRT